MDELKTTFQKERAQALYARLQRIIHDDEPVFERLELVIDRRDLIVLALECGAENRCEEPKVFLDAESAQIAPVAF